MKWLQYDEGLTDIFSLVRPHSDSEIEWRSDEKLVALNEDNGRNVLQVTTPLV